MDGYETTIEIRRREYKNGGHIPIVALTANVLEINQKRCFDCGMDYYIAKPVRREKLIEALKNFLKLKSAAA